MRADARELAFKLIFERLFVKDNFTDEEFFASLKKEEDVSFANDIIKCYDDHKEVIREIISSHLVGYELNRVYKVDLAILCEAIAEIKYIKTPYQVVINEAVKIAKKYSTENSGKFVNGVLSTIVKSLNSKEE